MAISRIKKTMLANLYAQVVTVLVAISSIPIFLSVWSVSDYGIWLILYSIPAYMVSADFGIGTASCNKMVILKSRVTSVEIDAVFGTSLRVIALVAFVIVVLASVLLVVFLQNGIFPTDVVIAAYLLSILSAASLFNPCIDGVLRFHGLYWESIATLNTLRLFEWVGGIVAIHVIPSLSAAAAGMLFTRLVANSITILLLTNRYATPRWSLFNYSSREMHEILKPALSFSLFPLANALSLQGVTALVGVFLGPASVVVFSCYRTITRTVTQLLALLNKSYWSEFSESYGRSDRASLRKLISECKKLNAITAILSTVALAIFGELIISTWTNDKVPFDNVFYYAMIAGVFLTGFWQADWVFLMATNAHSKLSIIFFTTSICTTALSGALLSEIGLMGAAVAILVFEVAILFFIRREISGKLCGVN